MTRRARALPSLLLATCLLTQPAAAQDCTPGTWVRSEVQPAPRSRFAATFDPSRGKLLIFGGENLVGSSTFAIPVWEWDGTVPGRGAWDPRASAISLPMPANQFGQMAFDAARSRAVFLGQAGSGWTWEWDPASGAWAEHRTDLAPDPRLYHSMVYAADRVRVFLYGGTLGSSTWWNDDLWEWDGASATWALVQAHSPLGSQPYVVMTYDLHRHRVVCFDPVNLKLWEYDPAVATWAQRFPAAMPTPRKYGAFTFDPASGHVFFFGGANGYNNSISYNDLWEWDGDAGTWTERVLSNPPPARYGASLVADAARHRMILFGGAAASDTIKFDDLFEFDPISGTEWVERIPASPAPRMPSGLVFDEARREAVLFGGSTVAASPVVSNDTWVRPSEGPLAGSWIATTPAISPPGRTRSGMVYNAATRRALLFGGSAGGSQPQQFGDTWEWESDSRQWVQRQPALAPEARYSPVLAYDAVRTDIILFGGAKPLYPLEVILFGDTWKWRSATSTWTQIFPPLSPPARKDAAMAYDAARDRIILFGGFDGANGYLPRTDTWEYNPSSESWTELFPAHVPPVNWQCPLAMAYNPDRGTMLLRCGTPNTRATWEWNGADWTAIPAATPLERYPGGPAFDTSRRTMLQFGGNPSFGSQLSQRTWEFTAADPPPILRHPQPLSLREGDTAAFAVSCPAPTPPTYRWRRNGIPLTNDGRITGSLTPILRIKPTLLSDAGDYDVLITGPCGTLTSNAAALSTTCYANCDLSTPALSASDYLCFLNAFAAADPYANCDNSTAPPTLNINDFICFLNRFSRGCN